MTDTAVILALTRPAIALAGRVAAALPGSRLLVPARFQVLAGTLAPASSSVSGYSGALGPRVGACFADRTALIGILALGALVRLIAPHLRGKTRDPAVVALDAGGRFVIPLLSGHLGGANALAVRLAAALDATPVLTTASDCQRTLAADLLGRELGWIAESSRGTLLRVSAALVNGEPAALVQEDGDADWWRGHAGGREGPPPANLQQYRRLEAVDPDAVAAVLWSGRRILPAALTAPFADRLAIYRPPPSRTPPGFRVALGLGCDRGTPAATIAEAVRQALTAAALAPAQVAAVASIDLKSDEPGLRDYAAAQGWTPRFYPASALAAVPVPNPSERVRAVTGTPSVSEAAALLAAGGAPAAGRLLVPKYRWRGPDGRSVTLAIARIEP